LRPDFTWGASTSSYQIEGGAEAIMALPVEAF